MKFILTFLIAILSISVYCQIERIDPPFWWVDMETNEIELLIYGKDIGNSELIISDSDIELLKIEKVENPNYLFATIRINATSAKSFDIKLNGKKNHTYSYELKQRLTSNPKYGIDASDLIYLIMPDRFANGDPSNDEIKSMNQSVVDRTDGFGRHGGDLQGIINHLDYLQKLSVTALWLNPFLENNQPEESYHGYAITDHYKVDSRLGSNELLKKLVRECKQKRIKMIMDVIYNHCGNEHFFIKDMPSSDWVHQWDEFTKTNYRATTLMDPYVAEKDKQKFTDGWFDTHMPDLNQKNPHVAKYLIQNSIWWIEYGRMDAFRIDTYTYPDQEFMSNLATAILKEYPDFSFFGETWVHGIPIQNFFLSGTKGNAIDSKMQGVTDFQLYHATKEAFNEDFGWTTGVNRLYYVLAQDYVYEYPMNNVIFLDNHDLDRYMFSVGNNLKKFKIGLGFLMTTRGIPQIYYGTEIGMNKSAASHADIREDFPGGWTNDSLNKFIRDDRTKLENKIFDYYVKLANWRRYKTVIHTGKLMQFVPEDGIYVYFRYNEDDCVMVIINQNEESKVLEMSRYKERTAGFRESFEVTSGMLNSNMKYISIPGLSIQIHELRKLR